MTSIFAPQEASHAARLEAAYAEATAHLTDKNIADQIARMSAERARSGYFIATPRAVEEEQAELLWNLRIELARRQAAAVNAQALAGATALFTSQLLEAYATAAE